MAKKPKNPKEMPVEETKNMIAAAKRLSEKFQDFKLRRPEGDGAMDVTKAEVDAMDQQFQDDDVTVRVLKINPSGKLTDVSENINPAGGAAPDTMAMGNAGKIDREVVKDMLARIMKGSSYQPSQIIGRDKEESIAMQRMEATLAESDKILPHFKN